MSMLSKDERDALADLSAAIKDLQASKTNNRATITFNANGLGVWVAMLFVQTAMLAALIVLFVKFERTQDYLNAIYMQAPHLKPPKEI